MLDEVAGKDLLRRHGVPVPAGTVCPDVADSNPPPTAIPSTSASTGVGCAPDPVQDEQPIEQAAAVPAGQVVALLAPVDAVADRLPAAWQHHPEIGEERVAERGEPVVDVVAEAGPGIGARAPDDAAVAVAVGEVAGLDQPGALTAGPARLVSGLHLVLVIAAALSLVAGACAVRLRPS